MMRRQDSNLDHGERVPPNRSLGNYRTTGVRILP